VILFFLAAAIVNLAVGFGLAVYLGASPSAPLGSWTPARWRKSRNA
jgi:hypothetical protein